MGNSASSSRRRPNSPSRPAETSRPQSQQQSPPHPEQQTPPPPPGGYPGQYGTPPGVPPGMRPPQYPMYPYTYVNGGAPYPPPPPQYYGQAPWPVTNGGYYMGGPRPPYYPAPVPPPQVPQHMAPVMKSSTIRNDVNLKKQTLRLEKDEEHPGQWLLAFSFDASLPGSASVLFLAREGEACSLTPTKPHLFKPMKFSFEKQLGQKYRQAPGTGIDLSKVDPRELNLGGVYAIAVRLEVVPKEPPADAPPRDEAPGAKLPSWVQSQTTYAALEKAEDGTYRLKVLKQKIWVAGVTYELQELYGCEQSSGGGTSGAAGGGGESLDSGKECVVCMSNPRDITVIPCRHMCVCRECAEEMRKQTDKCPICRSRIESFLEIDHQNRPPPRLSPLTQGGSSSEGGLPTPPGSEVATSGGVQGSSAVKAGTS